MYDKLARYYDQTHDALSDDIPFVLALADAANGRLLELGCGTGRLLGPLAQAGYAVIGLDNAAAMLARAKRRLASYPVTIQQQVTLVEADMTDFTLAADLTPVALCLLPYNTALHLDEPQLRQTLRQAATHLTKNGRLVLDLANPFMLAAVPDDQAVSLEATFTDAETNDIVFQFASYRPDETAQELQIIWWYDASPSGGGAVQRTVVPVTYHYRYPHQIELLLQQAGFRLEALYGWYDKRPVDEASERPLVTAVLA